ncbi:DUF1643 domain-containing protein [Paenibacillus hamazuiensis]|uniref:DUF1643 domain-containing protein n=1 Tax=Paenibacillus hamazuiensis TaxID=2936508 RepID=UPI00200DE227|nr:DUF1643 domain-containing protein [Paenibacillus hamazuiensis]
MKREAILKGEYRYRLAREWEEGKPRIVWVMLNPSTADHLTDDNTISKCITYSKRWGFGSLEVVNLFAYRSTDPKNLHLCDNPVGDDNDSYILESIRDTPMVIAAWGEHGRIRNRGKQVLELIRSAGVKVYALKKLKNGEPGHPLYLSNNVQPVLFGDL